VGRSKIGDEIIVFLCSTDVRETAFRSSIRKVRKIECSRNRDFVCSFFLIETFSFGSVLFNSMFSSLKITLNTLGVGFFRILAARKLERGQKH